MALSRKDRFSLKSQLVDALAADEWTFDKTNLLLLEFGLGPLDDGWHGPPLTDVVAGLPDADLIEMYALVMGIDSEEVEDVVESSADTGNWKPRYARVFLSHSAAHKQFAGAVADELAVLGIHGFVAHDTMAYSKPWQVQIEQALRSMEAFVALVHPEFNDSAWCHQEVGWGLGRRVPLFAVRLGADPVGFLGRKQWPSCAGQPPKEVAKVIGSWIASVPALGTSVVDGLLGALERAGNYFDAESAASRIAALETLTDDQVRQLGEIWWSNDQLHGGILATKAMKPFYGKNGRGWPPPKAHPVSAAVQGVDEEPF